MSSTTGGRTFFNVGEDERWPTMYVEPAHDYDYSYEFKGPHSHMLSAWPYELPQELANNLERANNELSAAETAIDLYIEEQATVRRAMAEKGDWENWSQQLQDYYFGGRDG